VAAQALNKEKEAQEEAEADLNQDDSDATPAVDEKTPVLRRATTTSSAGASSVAPEEREKMDEKRLSYYYLAKRMLRINHEQKYTYIAGVLGAIASGCVYPALAILFGESIAAFSLPMDQIRSASYKNGLWYFISAILSAIAIVIQNGSLSSTAETLTAKLRSITFRAILRQDIAFFDEEEHATGSLTSNLSDWPQKFNGESARASCSSRVTR
jgi:ATP-binding cassette subfamily B (MDR/TAP) protein 1